MELGKECSVPELVVMNQFYGEGAPTGRLLRDVVEAARARGWAVRVVCDGNEYVAGRGTLGRVWSYARYAAACVWEMRGKCEVLLTMTTPPLLPVMGMLSGARHVIWEMDVYPDIAVELGTFARGGVAERVTGWLADMSRRRADCVIALGECMKERLERRGVDGKKIVVAENWDEGEWSEVETNGRVRATYAGNMGMAHEFGTVRGAIERLRGDGRFEFVFAGEGAGRKELEGLEGERVKMLPHQTRERYRELLRGSQAGLVTQKDGTAGAVVPSKVYGLLAAGRPVVYVGPKEATPARVIERHKCGWRVAVGDVEGLTGLLMELAEEPGRLAEAGRRARAAYEAEYCVAKGTERVLKLLLATDGHR